MLSQIFVENLLSICLGLLFINIWCLYYITINSITPPVPQSSDTKKPKTIELSRSMRSSIVGCLILGIILINVIFIFNLNSSMILSDTIFFSNKSSNYFYCNLILLLVLLLLGFGLFKQNIVFSIEYTIFVFLVTVSSYLLISSTNLFLTIFLLEFIALLIFAKMAVSRSSFKKSVIDITSSFKNNYKSYGLFNALFFQFWANFISSICLFFSLINVHYIFGTSNFYFINFLLYVIGSSWYLSGVFVSFILVIFITGFFIKLGLSPYQFFKIETYKGIPLYILIVYTTLYLIVYIILVLVLFTHQLPALREFTGIYALVMLTLTTLYLVSLLFDTKNFKAFLSYSTLIIVTNIFIIILIL